MTTTLERPGEPQDSLYFPTDVNPEQIFQEIGRLRKEARDEIDRLVGFLDKTDDYMFRELEDSIDDNPQGEGGDEEPSLGSIERHPSSGGLPDGRNSSGDQTRWAAGGVEDREDEHDGREPDEDREPSLGAFEGHDDHDVSWAGDTFAIDYELEPAESGIGDIDGLLEQVGPQDWQSGKGGMV